MRKVNTTIKYIEPYSIAEDAEIEVGDKLISINGHDFSRYTGISLSYSRI